MSEFVIGMLVGAASVIVIEVVIVLALRRLFEFDDDHWANDDWD